MAEIIVNIGSEEKAVCGLTNETTCAEVIEVLLKDKHTRLALNDGLAQENERFVLIESYLGSTKILSLQTRILPIWKALGKEKHPVKLYLKTETNLKLNQQQTPISNLGAACGTKYTQAPQNHFDASEFFQKHSPGQIKQLCRNIKQHRKAMYLRNRLMLDDNNNDAENTKLNVSRINSTKFTVMYSDEQFLDGISIDSKKERSLRPQLYPSKSSQSFKDPCNCFLHVSYPQSVKPVLYHNPYCIKSGDSSASKRRAHHHKHRSNVSDLGMNRWSQFSQNSADFSSSSSNYNNQSKPKVEAQLSGDDADDEKSVLTENKMLLSRQNFSSRSNNILPSLNGHCKNEIISMSSTTITDSSTATSSDTSNTSSSSFTSTSSSDTSASSMDWSNEDYLAKRAAALAAAQANSAQKSKNGSVSKFFKIGKLNSSKKKKKPSLLKTGQINPPNNTKTRKDQGKIGENTYQSENTTTAKEILHKDFTQLKTLSKDFAKNDNGSDKERNANHTSNSQSASKPAFVSDSQSETTKEQLRNLVLSQQQALNELNKKSSDSSHEIQEIEMQLQEWKTKLQENNNAQEKHLNGVHINLKDFFSNSSSTPQFIHKCDDVKALEQFINTCELIVTTQLHIEDFKRQADIACQDVRDEVWKLSTKPEGSVLADDLINLARNLNPDANFNENLDNASSTLGLLMLPEEEKNFSGKQKSALLSELDTLEVQHAKGEFEAGLDLSLRLAKEMEEVEGLMSNCCRLLQSKDEKMLDLVRELAQSPDGISPHLWDEYGELLTAYDNEIAFQLTSTTSQNVENENSKQPQRYATDLDKANLELVSAPAHDVSVIEQQPPSENAVDHASLPWLQFQQCKHEKLQSQNIYHHPKILRRSSTATDLKPKKKPLNKSLSTSLLPMFPVCVSRNNSYEELKKLDGTVFDENYDATSTIISTENAIPKQVIFHHDSVDSLHGSVQGKSNESNSTDDSGNVSAGSTSCDLTGSPRTSSISIESQDSAHSSPLFFHEQTENKKDHFERQFPSQLKPQTQNSLQPNNFKKPPIPVKSQAVKSAAALIGRKSSGVPSLNSENDLQGKNKLIRRNSSYFNHSPIVVSPQVPFARRASSFGKCGVKPGSFSVLTPNTNLNEKQAHKSYQPRKQKPINESLSKKQNRCRINSTPSCLPSFCKMTLQVAQSSSGIHEALFQQKSNDFNKPLRPPKLPLAIKRKEFSLDGGKNSCAGIKYCNARSSSISCDDSFDKLSRIVNGTLV